MDMAAPEPVRLLVHGASGRMGLEILAAAHQRCDCEIAAAMVRAVSLCVGEPVSRKLPGFESALEFRATLDPETGIDVVIDFSLPEALDTALAIARERRVAFVCGTTGLSAEQRTRLEDAAAHIPVLWSANFSLGVALLKRIVALAAAQLGEEFDAEILEIHHRHKRDAPSGTALALGQAIASARRQVFENVARLSREGSVSGRVPSEIGFAALRAADVVGEHTVIFASEGERLEFTHRANSRTVFASGAVRSAIWLSRQPPGWYDLADVLG
jgi:4-hydroxy-tetrahydrodipicolinate reductase